MFARLVLAHVRKLVLLPLAIAMVVAGTACVQAQNNTELLQYLPEDAVVAFAAFPGVILSQPEMELVPREIITAAGIKELGFDPVAIEQVLAFVQQPAGLGGPPGFGAVLRFSKPYNREQLLPMLVQNATLEDLGGKPFYRAPAPIMPSVYLPDARTIVIAPQLTLEVMLAKRATGSVLGNMLRATAGKYHASMVATLDPVRDMINGALGVVPPPPPQFEKFLAIPNMISKLELNVNYNQNLTTRLVIHASDAKTATELEALLNEGIAVGQQMLMAAIASEQTGDDPIEQATLKYMERLTNHFATLIKPQRESDQVVISLESGANMATTGVLVGLLLPAVQAAREAARRASAANNLRQIALAMHNYHDTHNHFPPAATYDADGKPLLSWRVLILPFLDEGNLYNEFHLDEPWDSEHNRKLIDKIPSALRCPNNPEAIAGKTNYLVPIGEDTAFGGKNGIHLRNITDGTSNTIMALEVANDAAVIWTKPDDWAVDDQDLLKGLRGLRPGGFQAGLCDGSVRFIAESINLNLLRALLTKSGGEVVQDF